MSSDKQPADSQGQDITSYSEGAIVPQLDGDKYLPPIENPPNAPSRRNTLREDSEEATIRPISKIPDTDIPSKVPTKLRVGIGPGNDTKKEIRSASKTRAWDLGTAKSGRLPFSPIDAYNGQAQDDQGTSHLGFLSNSANHSKRSQAPPAQSRSLRATSLLAMRHMDHSRPANDMVSATLKMPTLEKGRDSLMRNESYQPRPSSSYAANDPYNLSTRRTTMDALPTVATHQLTQDGVESRPGPFVNDSYHLPLRRTTIGALPTEASQHSERDDIGLRSRRHLSDTCLYIPSERLPSSENHPSTDHAFSSPAMLPNRSSSLLVPVSDAIKFGYTLFRSRTATSDNEDEYVAQLPIVTKVFQLIYFLILLRLPSLYFRRISWLFDTANLSLFEITEMAFTTFDGADPTDKSQMTSGPKTHEREESELPPGYGKLKKAWEDLIDSFKHEWEIFNVVSALLLTAILTILQIDAAASDPITRYAALFSLMYALTSLLFSSIYILGFGTIMRKTYITSECAKVALDSNPSVMWNLWVMLAMPSIWLTWSIIFFIVTIMSFIWRTNSANAMPTFILSSTGLLVVRIALSAVLGLGILDVILVANTLRLYADAANDWKKYVNLWRQALKREKMQNDMHTVHVTTSAPTGDHLPPSLPPTRTSPASPSYDSDNNIHREEDESSCTRHYGSRL